MVRLIVATVNHHFALSSRACPLYTDTLQPLCRSRQPAVQRYRAPAGATAGAVARDARRAHDAGAPHKRRAAAAACRVSVKDGYSLGNRATTPAGRSFQHGGGNGAHGFGAADEREGLVTASLPPAWSLRRPMPWPSSDPVELESEGREGRMSSVTLVFVNARRGRHGCPSRHRHGGPHFGRRRRAERRLPLAAGTVVQRADWPLIGAGTC